MYQYSGFIDRVIDGDTVVLYVDLGFRIMHRITARLAGIDAPEARGPERVEGAKSTLYLESLVVDRRLTVETFKDDKDMYGRYIVKLFNEKNECINDLLVENGYAERADY